MSTAPLPPLWLALLAEAKAAPGGVLSLRDDPRGDEAVDAAERMTDLGLLRIVTARHYRISEAGQQALSARGGKKKPPPEAAASLAPGSAPGAAAPAPAKGSGGFWSRLLGSKD
ncbi:hypothetical protein HOY34_12515 [Xinfangfangia sp. D13-10-4-6]|uniref:hypothetical protein n=1 Tax=Pseudogemmobacter hezensis TaxID=2737662 RepID=UPI00155633F1|nr:hypothetical protein [Pseudogemmobacter hezensis]NPD16023.1 hypothetical protein [Pseudogemmobacter hezensis]